MAKVTSKYQVTIPREISKKYQIEPGDDIDWVAAGEVIRVIPPRGPAQPVNRESHGDAFNSRPRDSQASRRFARGRRILETSHGLYPNDAILREAGRVVNPFIGLS